MSADALVGIGLRWARRRLVDDVSRGLLRRRQCPCGQLGRLNELLRLRVKIYPLARQFVEIPAEAEFARGPLERIAESCFQLVAVVGLFAGRAYSVLSIHSPSTLTESVQTTLPPFISW